MKQTLFHTHATRYPLQDNNHSFRRLVGATQPATAPRGPPGLSSSPSTSSPSGPGSPGASNLNASLTGGLTARDNLANGQTVVVLLADNEATAAVLRLVCAMMRAGRDSMHLVHIVSQHKDVEPGKALVAKWESIARASLAQVRALLTPLHLRPMLQLKKHLSTRCADVAANCACAQNL